MKAETCLRKIVYWSARHISIFISKTSFREVYSLDIKCDRSSFKQFCFAQLVYKAPTKKGIGLICFYVLFLGIEGIIFSIIKINIIKIDTSSPGKLYIAYKTIWILKSKYKGKQIAYLKCLNIERHIKLNRHVRFLTCFCTGTYAWP